MPFACINKKLTNNITITLLEIKDLTDEIVELLDKNFVKICRGTSDSDLDTVKIEVADLYKSKDVPWIMGATAEFFIHLYINNYGFKQECLFLNLEEGSIKKGFDGLYSKNREKWLMESKSGSIETKGICHSSKIKEAMLDLQGKVSGNVKNNPWKNAYSHVSHYDVGATVELRKSIQKLSDDFIRKQFHHIEEFNTMPCATIFLTGTWNAKSQSDIINEINLVTSCLKGKHIHVICVTQKSINLFLKYIGLGD